MKRITRYAALLAVLLAAGFTVPRYLLHGEGGVDFLQYWSASRLTIAGANPYDPPSMERLQRAAWKDTATAPLPILMWNPPQILSLMLPFALLPFEEGYSVWFACALGMILWSVALSKRLGGAARRGPFLPHAVYLIFLASFPPFATALWYGQVSPVLLIGFCLALAAQQRGMFFYAGLALSLTFFKPHLLYLFYLYSFIAALRARSFRWLAGVAAGTFVLSLLPAVFQPEILSQYFAAASAAPPIYWHTPTVGSWLQYVYPHGWIRFLPTLLCTPMAMPWMIRHAAWDSALRHLLVLIPLSLLTNPYGWQYDQMLLLPGITLLFSGTALRGRVLNYRPSPLFITTALLANAVFFLIPRAWGQETSIWYPALFLAFGVCTLRESDVISQRGL